jgi:hypothetical protein
MAIWMPMLAFEVPAGVWLLVKGVPPRHPLARATPASRAFRNASASGG